MLNNDLVKRRENLVRKLTWEQCISLFAAWKMIHDVTSTRGEAKNGEELSGYEKGE